MHLNRRTLGAVALAALALAVAGYLWGDDLWTLLGNAQAVGALVERAGMWGPLALVALGAIQVIIAPIPGYAVGITAGFLFGPLWGGLYAATGMLIGGMTAMWMGRTFCRACVRWMVGETKLARWESVTHSSSPLVWLFLLLGPVGDLPFWIAGLSSVRYGVIFGLALFIRVPTIFLSTAVGGGAVSLAWMGVALVIASIAVALAFRYRTPLGAWYDKMLFARTEGEGAAILLPAPVDAETEDL
jgi:uncharacterized membrane protein YdjX (TVP38/TMEM64 family)